MSSNLKDLGLEKAQEEELEGKIVREI